MILQKHLVIQLKYQGGISFFSGRHGWACDGVRNYQVLSKSTSSEVYC